MSDSICKCGHRREVHHKLRCEADDPFGCACSGYAWDPGAKAERPSYEALLARVTRLERERDEAREALTARERNHFRTRADGCKCPTCRTLGGLDLANAEKAEAACAQMRAALDGAKGRLLAIATSPNRRQALEMIDAALATDADRALLERVERMTAGLIQARGALLLDAMVDDDGKPFGTTSVALKAVCDGLREYDEAEDAARAALEGRDGE